MNQPRLENWFVTGNDQVAGQVYNHPTFKDGQVVFTTPIAALDEALGEVVTRNTSYILGKRFEE